MEHFLTELFRTCPILGAEAAGEPPGGLFEWLGPRRRACRPPRAAERVTVGWLLPGESKSIEPMAARLHPKRVQAARQSLHHRVAQAAWDVEAVLGKVRRRMPPWMQQQEAIAAYVVDNIRIPKPGGSSVGIARHHCGQLGKQADCQVAVSPSVAASETGLAVVWRL